MLCEDTHNKNTRRAHFLLWKAVSERREKQEDKQHRKRKPRVRAERKSEKAVRRKKGGGDGDLSELHAVERPKRLCFGVPAKQADMTVWGSEG